MTNEELQRQNADLQAHNNQLRARTITASIETGVTYRHIKTGGLYTIIGSCIIEATGEPAYAYRAPNGIVWVRPIEEFRDGRFEKVSRDTVIKKEDRLQDFKRRLDIRLNDYLCEMKPGHDDSVQGFSEAVDVVYKLFQDMLK